MKVSKSAVGSAEADAAARIVVKGFLGMGPEVRAFEEELAAYLGGDAHVACVNTGTSALHLALQACGIGPNDEVLVPTLTYVASFQAISACGATPVACDVQMESGLLNLEDAVGRLTPRTKAIMPVHYASATGDLESVYRFAQANGLRVIEDAAHAFGCSHRGVRIGANGDVVCFSFDGIKNITSGEGGAVVTRDATVISRVRDARLLGVEKDTEKRFAGERSWEFDVHAQGWRYHMSDIMAAIGRVQLAKFETELAPKRRALAAHYRDRLSSCPGLRLFRNEAECVPHILPIRVLNGLRDRVRAALAAESIETGIHYKPNHLLARFSATSARLPVAEQLYTELLTLPLHPSLTISDLDIVMDVVQSTLNR